MKKILLFIPTLFVTFFISISCKFAPSSDMGDTVTAAVFAPIDKTVLAKDTIKQKNNVPDSTDVFIIGDGSTRRLLQLISYPSQRDTMMFGKKRPLKIKGSTQFGSVVRVGFVFGKDSVKLVKTIEEIKPTKH